MTSTLPSSLYSLLDQIIDYAGLFPPANLSLEPAMRNFIRYQTWPERWMLSRFIIPAAKLGELVERVENGLAWEGTLAFSVLGQGGADQPAFLAGVQADIQAVNDFRARMGDRVQLDVYETRTPEGESPQVLLNEVIPWLQETSLSPFFETPFGTGWERRAEALIRAIATALPTTRAANRATNPSDFRVGFKLRTGGVTADAFPTPAQVAFALCACRDARVPMKCTAGLHHPVRSYRAEVGTKMHGFLNVFAAGVMARAGLEDAEVEKILEEEDATQFRFYSDRISWNDWEAGIAQIEDIRREGLVSFGSCSFEEPKEDLEALGYSLIKS